MNHHHRGPQRQIGNRKVGTVENLYAAALRLPGKTARPPHSSKPPPGRSRGDDVGKIAKLGGPLPRGLIRKQMELVVGELGRQSAGEFDDVSPRSTRGNGQWRGVEGDPQGRLLTLAPGRLELGKIRARVGDQVAGVQQRIDRSGVCPPSFQFGETHGAFLNKKIVDVSDFQFATERKA